MKSSLFKRSLKIADRKTSISMEDDFWSSLREIAKERKETLSQLISSINAQRTHPNLSSAVRLFVLGFYRDQLSRPIPSTGICSAPKLLRYVGTADQVH